MKLYAPEYYKNFTCIADRCKHSCCVGWEIDIDDVTMKKYAEYNGNYSDKIRESIEYSDEPHFKLDECERCPHLNEKGLCNIILNVGEDYLCHICREHPRFYNDTPRGREVGLGMACEEACRLILESDDYANTEEVGEIDEEIFFCDFDSIPLREDIYRILSDDSIDRKGKLCLIENKYGVSVDIISDKSWRGVLDGLEYLDEEHKKLFEEYSSDAEVPTELEKKLERALAYFVYRHCTEVYDEEDFRTSLGFCLFCERLLASMCSSGRDVFDSARILSEEIEYSEDNTESLKTRIGTDCTLTATFDPYVNNDIVKI